MVGTHFLSTSGTALDAIIQLPLRGDCILAIGYTVQQDRVCYRLWPLDQKVHSCFSLSS